jgi:DNA-binding NarL/FixJ family response regulator
MQERMIDGLFTIQSSTRVGGHRLVSLTSNDSGGHTKEMNIVQILLVDDYAMMRQGLRSVLDDYEDIQVVGEARDGLEAVQLVGELRPQVVLMDINMPKMDGIEATAKIMHQYPETIIIGLSVNATKDNREAMTRAGASRLLSKEVAVEQLHDAVYAAVSERNRGQTPPGL